MNFNFDYTKEMQERMESINSKMDYFISNDTPLVSKEDLIWQIDTIKLMGIDADKIIREHGYEGEEHFINNFHMKGWKDRFFKVNGAFRGAVIAWGLSKARQESEKALEKRIRAELCVPLDNIEKILRTIMSNAVSHSYLYNKDMDRLHDSINKFRFSSYDKYIIKRQFIEHEGQPSNRIDYLAHFDANGREIWVTCEKDARLFTIPQLESMLMYEGEESGTNRNGTYKYVLTYINVNEHKRNG